MPSKPNNSSPNLTALLEALSRDLETQQRFLRKLRSVIKTSKARLPEGSYREETGDPLDVPAAFRALYDLLEEDHFEELAAHLTRARSWLDGAPLPVESEDRDGARNVLLN